MRRYPAILAAFLMAFGSPVLARDIVVRSSAEMQAAIKAAQPGDQIILANGDWRDVDIQFDAQGTAAKPIILKAMTPGKVIVSGASALRLAGRHLVVKDLVFRSGQPLGEAAIVTRIGNRWAENARLTGIVIDGFSNPDRRKEDHWVALYGRNIRFDHSHFEGKQNLGAMFVVIRMPGWPLDNNIRLDHNYFGPRPVLGSNGGETLRIGTSEESLSPSGTVIEDNIFERCDGEVEVISIKSGGNTIRRNLFLRSQGAVVLRHGNGNLVESNIFLGMGEANTGGIRVINRDQTVRNNYLEGLAGGNFTAALSIMNGVPNSVINRYHQVVGGEIANNTLVNPVSILFGAGASAERSAAPEGVKVAKNLVVTDLAHAPFRVDAPTTGIQFAGNVTNISVPDGVGFEQKPVALRRGANGLLYPRNQAMADLGASRQLVAPKRSAVGPAWYRPASQSAAQPKPSRTVTIQTSGALVAALANARDGDVLQLGNGTFTLDEPLPVRRDVTISGAGAHISFRAATLFVMEEGGSLTLRGLTISGKEAPSAVGNAVIRSSLRTMLTNYVVDIEDCLFLDLAHTTQFDLIATTPATFAGKVRIAKTQVTDLSGAVLAANSERGNAGLYPVEEIEFEQLSLTRVGMIADVLRQGTDESTFGPRFSLLDSQITESGGVRLSGVQVTRISQNRFLRSAKLEVIHSVGEPSTRITNNEFAASPPPVVSELYFKGPLRAEIQDNRLQ